MAAARVRPNVRKRDLAARALLQEHLAGANIEEEDGEGAMERAPGLGGGEYVGVLLGGRADYLVGGGENYDGVAGHELGLGEGWVPR